ncbi:MAG: hypothetical protein HC892_06955 [Saprospiraceae bacterium]|nr:hypothetical protein [Saprospiraceae bacterium]
MPISDDLDALLAVMEAKEFDLQIIAQIKQLRTSRDKTSAWKIILTFDVPIHQLPEPPKEAYAEIIKAIQQSNDANIQMQLMNYLSRNPSLELVPHLMKLLKQSVNQREVVSVLETLYAYPNRVSYEKQKDYWLNLWQQDSLNYQKWGQKLLQEKLTAIKTCKEVTINDLNTAFQSPYLDEAGRVICLDAISKIKPTRNIRRLNPTQGISVEKELNYLEPLKLTYREWIELLPLFKVNAPEKLLVFYKTKLADSRAKEQGWGYAKLFQQPWINSYLANGQSDKSIINPIKKVLNEYLDDKEVPEREKDIAVIALAKIENAGKTLEEQLKLSFQIKVSDEARAAYQKELIAAISYTQISSALRDYSKLSPTLNYNFLQADFGVPVFDLSDVTTRTDIISRHLTMNTSKFFSHYLREFGVNFEDDKQKLDFNAVYEMLEYDLCLPFSGSNAPRNFYSYGLIKMLEAEFGFLIGFHPKLNCADNQPCESLSKRTFSWMRYLEQQRLIVPSNQPRSFLYAAFTSSIN